jgi:DNA-binding HxlR family transcriptional regulator
VGTSESDVRRCSIAGALDLVGDRWSLLVLRELAYGQHRFSDIQRRTGAPRDILTARLRKLESVGVLHRAPDPERPTRQLYGVSTAGAELTPVLLALKEWGDRHVNPGDEPVVTEHVCGAVFHPRTHCAYCGSPLERGELRVVGGDAPLPSFEVPKQGSG